MWPWAARAAARLTVTDDFPTPPLPLATARIRAVRGISVSGALLGLLPGATHQVRALLGVHLAHADLHAGDTGQAPQARLDVVADLGPHGTAGDGQGDLHPDHPVLVHVDVLHHAEIDDAGVQLGVEHRLEHPPDLFRSGPFSVHVASLNR